ncbi:hypothetical protein [Falsiporphyromonas endometrii]|uniref:Uncharacterized protein n=1 Tax=Falsiporphyromonas endometrii TaxID=1387297 RepID=A0ABV9K8P8_9PORP
MDKVSIINRINEISKDLKSRDEYITRQELSVELSSLGIDGDSLELSRLVWDSYKKYGNSETIRDRILANDGLCSLVEDYRVTSLMEDGKINDAVIMVIDKLSASKQSLDEMQEVLETSLALNPDSGMDLLSSAWAHLKGDAGIKKVTHQATIYYEDYVSLVNQYLHTEHAIKSNIRDFLTLRAIINEIYTKYISMLKDILGDSLNEIAPEMFDFGMIKWLDVQEIIKRVELEFGKVLDQCKFLMGEISQSFKELTGRTMESVLNVGATFMRDGKSEKAYAKMVQAGINTAFAIFDHYSDARAKTNLLKADFEKMKRNLKKDQTRIKADWARLFTIFKTLNDVQIPKAKAFTECSDAVLDREFRQLMEKIYSNPAILPLKEKRDDAIERSRKSELSMSDHQSNIELYRGMIVDLNTIMSAKSPFYNEGISSMPHKPNMFVKVITFGIAKLVYNKKMAKWYPEYGPAVLEYESLRDDKADKEAKCSKHELGLTEDRREYNNAKEEIREISSEIVKGIGTSDEVKKEVLQKLNTIVRLLRLGKDIMETKIDKDLQEVVQIKDVETLPAIAPEIEGKISDMVNLIGSSVMKVSNETLSNARKEKEYINAKNQERHEAKIAMAQQEGRELTEAEKAAPSEYMNMSDFVSEEQIMGAVNSAAVLLNSYIEFAKEKSMTNQVSREYDKQLDEMSKKFRQQMAALDNKALFVQEVLKKINTSEDPEIIKTGLLQLGEFSGEDLSMDDLDALLKGDMIIEI